MNPDTKYMHGVGSHMADGARVIGIVEKVPPGLLPDGDILSWETSMDLEVGDTVWFDYMDGLHATSFIVDDDRERKGIPHSNGAKIDRERRHCDVRDVGGGKGAVESHHEGVFAESNITVR